MYKMYTRYARHHILEYIHENDTASGTIANETAKPEVMAVKYCVLRVGFVKSIFLPNPLDNDLAFATIDSSCDGGIDSTPSQVIVRPILQ